MLTVSSLLTPSILAVETWLVPSSRRSWVRRKVLLGESFHLLGVILVFFFFLGDDAFAETAAAVCARLTLRRGRGTERSFLRLAVRAHAHLEAFRLFLFALEVDRHFFRPSVLREGLFILRDGFLQLGDTLLEQGGLSVERSSKMPRSTRQVAAPRCEGAFPKCCARDF